MSAPMPMPMPGAPAGASARPIRRGVAYGTLWALSITASEALVLPFGPLAMSPSLEAMLLILLHYGIEGALLGCTILALEPRLDRWWKVAAASIVTALGTTTINGMLWIAGEAIGFGNLRDLLGEPGSSWSHQLYVFWLLLVHGSLFMVACVLAARAERSGRLFGAAQIARDKTEALLDKTAIEALYGQLDPAFLVRAMRAVRDRTAADAAGAERLLDELVAFLRLAMPGVRSGCSTLETELQLAAAYAGLQRSVDPHGTGWQIDADPALPAMPFPPLLLLPLLDALMPPGASAPLTLRASLDRETQRITLAVVTPPGMGREVDVPAPLRYRLRVALQATLGDAWQITDRASGATLPGTMAIVLRIDARPQAPAPEPLPPPLPGAAEVLHPLRAASFLITGALR